MRIQYRYRQVTISSGMFGPGYVESSMTPWQDVPISGLLPNPAISALRDLQVRMVDEHGNTILPTPPFKPAYYQRTGGSKPGGITWCTVAPDKAHWKRRDDIKP